MVDKARLLTADKISFFFSILDPLIPERKVAPVDGVEDEKKEREEEKEEPV